MHRRQRVLWGMLLSAALWPFSLGIARADESVAEDERETDRPSGDAAVSESPPNETPPSLGSGTGSVAGGPGAGTAWWTAAGAVTTPPIWVCPSHPSHDYAWNVAGLRFGVEGYTTHSLLWYGPVSSSRRIPYTAPAVLRIAGASALTLFVACVAAVGLSRRRTPDPTQGGGL